MAQKDYGAVFVLRGVKSGEIVEQLRLPLFFLIPLKELQYKSGKQARGNLTRFKFKE